MRKLAILKIKAPFGICLVASLISTNVLADNSDAKAQIFEAGRMHVQISNMTNSDCQLASRHLMHGTLDSSPPQSLAVNESKSFEVKQMVTGPDIILNYSCASGNISFEVEQGFVSVVGRTPTVTVRSTSGLKLSSQVTSSSILLNSPGIANITLSRS